MAEASARFDINTPAQIIERHNTAVGRGDLDEIAADYAEDAVFISAEGALRGHEGIKAAFRKIREDLPPGSDVTIYNTVFEGDVLFLQWRATTDAGQIDDGVDTFLFRDGKILVQTVRYTVTPRA
jgi:ketosteroid isomerase-like protein